MFIGFYTFSGNKQKEILILFLGHDTVVMVVYLVGIFVEKLSAVEQTM